MSSENPLIKKIASLDEIIKKLKDKNTNAAKFRKQLKTINEQKIRITKKLKDQLSDIQ
jgi:predicted transcriptional regulator